MWNTVAICEHCQPKFVIWENVKNVLSKKHRHNFDKYLEEMDRIGYNNFYQILNAKDYGVPQNRERIFVVSIRKDLNKDFEFPKGFDNGIRLKDILEDEVDEKYYLSLEKTRGLIEEYKGREVELPCIGASRGRNPENRSDRTVGAPTRQFLEVNINGTSNTLTSVAKDNLVIESKIQSIRNLNPSERGMNGEVYDTNYLSPTLTTNKGEGSKILVKSNEPKIIESLKNNTKYRIRKLTPKECWRLMGFKDKQFLKAEQVCSNSQLYKQAGNSIVVNVMEEIFKNLMENV